MLINGGYSIQEIRKVVELLLMMTSMTMIYTVLNRWSNRVNDTDRYRVDNVICAM